MTEDFFIPERKTGGAYHDDTVLIQVSGTPYGKRTEASVIKVLERGLKRIVGIYEQNKSFGFVIPDNRRIDGDIFVSKKNSMGAVTGHK